MFCTVLLPCHLWGKWVDFFFSPLTFSTVLPGLEKGIHEIPNSFLPWAREKQEGLNAAVTVLFYAILFHLISPRSTR